MSSTLADQLKVKILNTLLGLWLAVQGSRSKINTMMEARIQYQEIDTMQHFNIINLNSYDIILGMPWLYQHSVCIGWNPARIIIGRGNPEPVQKGHDTKLMVHALGAEGQTIEAARTELQQRAEPLCQDVDETDLPPLWVINHTIPLIDESKIYSWRPSKCPEVFRSQWAEKRDAYLRSGCWKITSSGNTVPMLLIPKPKTSLPQLQTVIDLQQQNKNMH